MTNGTYIGFNGQKWDAMPYSDALKIVIWLASHSFQADREHHNWLTRNDPRAAADDGDLRRLGEAILTATEFNRVAKDRLNAMQTPRLGTGWPAFAYEDTPDLNPADPIDAIRICLAAAEPEAISPTDAEMLQEAFGHHVKRRSHDMARSLICLHGTIIRKWPAMSDDPKAADATDRLYSPA